MTEGSLVVKPANEATWADLAAVFGTTGESSRCFCQWTKVRDKDWRSIPIAERAFRLREQTDCGYPESDETSGLIAYLDGEPVGWVAVEPRSEYLRLRYMRVPWSGRDEDKDDDTVWAVTCFVVRVAYRRRGVSYALAKAAVEFARERGARAIEAYPMLVPEGQEITWGELFVGKTSVFEAAGYQEVSHPSKRRKVMRIDFA